MSISITDLANTLNLTKSTFRENVYQKSHEILPSSTLFHITSGPSFTVGLTVL